MNTMVFGKKSTRIISNKYDILYFLNIIFTIHNKIAKVYVHMHKNTKQQKFYLYFQ